MRAVELKLGGTLKILMSEVDAPQPGCFLTIRYDGFTIKAKGDAMAYTLPADKQVHVQGSYVDAGGNPAVVDGEVTWDSSNEKSSRSWSMPPTRRRQSCAPPARSAARRSPAYADADLGDGVREIATTMDVTVMAGEAVAGTIAPVSEPEPIPHVEHRKWAPAPAS
jgi:hypothetical protein